MRRLYAVLAVLIAVSAGRAQVKPTRRRWTKRLLPPVLKFVVVPIVELYVVVQVAHHIGLLPTVALVLAVSAAGGWLCKREGVGLYRRITDEVSRGQVPGASLVDGFLAYWDAHRAVLRTRNLAAQEGDARFRDVRNQSLRPLTEGIARMLVGPDGSPRRAGVTPNAAAADLIP